MSESNDYKYLKHPLIWPDTIEFRLYQKKISDVATEQNTLVILPTALGKTVISAIVAANVLYSNRDARVLVMAPTRPLVVQHRSSFMKTLKLRTIDTTLLTGKTPPSHRGSIWKGTARIVFATPQVVRNDLIEDRLSLENYGLIIFDECHRAVKKYAYTEIAKFYVSQAPYPLILGMTASPGSNLSRVLEICRNLYIERVEYRNEEDAEVKPYIHSIDVKWNRVDLPNDYLTLRTIIWSMLDKRLNWLYNKGIINRKPRYITRRSLLEAGDELRLMLEESKEEARGRIFTAIINQSLSLTLFHMLELLETQGAHTLRCFLERVNTERRAKRSYAILVNDSAYKELKSLLTRTPVEHPKLGLVVQIVRGQLLKKQSSRILVFTQYRDTASHIVDQLKRLPGILVDRFVGQASRVGDKGLKQEEQVERIRMLEKGELNVLVATSIGEEGLDIPAVDHVIFYEPIPSEIRYIQRRGRTGRKSIGKVTILATNDTLDMIYLYSSRKKTEKMRSVAENINLKLQPIIRRLPEQYRKPMDPTELERLDEEGKHQYNELEYAKAESEALKEFDRKVRRVSRILYMKLLEQGVLAADLTHIASEIECDDALPQVLTVAIEKMVKEGVVMKVDQGYAVTSAVKYADKKTYEIMIEKIYPGAAVVLVNDKWRARLIHEEYNGPRKLIKKNSRFRAAADLYRTNKTLCIRVREVTKVLN